MSVPKINVTPLIDVLLVLLIIFMVVAPMKPSSFTAKLPPEPRPPFPEKPNPNTLVVSIANDLSLSLNGRPGLGTSDDPQGLTRELSSIFDERTKRFNIDDEGNVVKVVFIRAPRKIAYGNVVKVIDAVKTAGAEPMALQIDQID